MTLRDHFHPPLSERRHWHSFHNGWAYNITEALNLSLPEGYFAEANVQFGIEIDVATFEENDPDESSFLWQPPAPTLTIPLTIMTDIVEVTIYEQSAGPQIVGAIEIVSPANKDRAAHRNAFVSKCETLLQQGIGLVVIDVVTNRRANLHDELLARLNAGQTADSHPLYTAAYRPNGKKSTITLDIWHQSLNLNAHLPTMPLWLRGGGFAPVDLQTSYTRTCRAHRID